LSAVLDTNALVYDTFEDSVLHSKAKAGLDGLERWHIPTIVIHEYVWFMKGQGIDLSFAKDKVIEYVTHEKAEIVRDDADGILFSIERISGYRYYNDYVILAVAKRLGRPLFTFDNRLREAASRVGVEVI